MRFGSKLVAFALAASISKVAAADLDVYIDNNIATDWQDWSWSSTIDFAATDIFSGSSGTSLSVTSDPWSALSLYNPNTFKGYAGLQFDVAVSSR
jgi:phosphatidylinositol glycan class B